MAGKAAAILSYVKRHGVSDQVLLPLGDPGRPRRSLLGATLLAVCSGPLGPLAIVRSRQFPLIFRFHYFYFYLEGQRKVSRHRFSDLKRGRIVCAPPKRTVTRQLPALPRARLPATRLHSLRPTFLPGTSGLLAQGRAPSQERRFGSL
jgi:hypothetical protein